MDGNLSVCLGYRRDGLLTNSSDFDRFTTLVGSPKIEDVRVQIAFA